MSVVVNKSTLSVIDSANTPDYMDGNWLINPILPTVPRKYWELSGDQIVEMGQTSKDAVDAAEAAQTLADNIELIKAEYERRTSEFTIGVAALNDRMYNFNDRSRAMFFERHALVCVGLGLTMPWKAYDNVVYSVNTADGYSIMAAAGDHIEALFIAKEADIIAITTSGSYTQNNLDAVLDGTIY